MRTIKLLPSAVAVLLIAASANAGIILTVRRANNGDVDPDLELEVDIQLLNQDGTGGTGTDGINILQFSWDYTGTPVGPGPTFTCFSFNPQYGCNWGSPTMEWVGSQLSNANGVGWLWGSLPGSGGPSSANATFTDLGQFTLAAGTWFWDGRTISLKDFEVFDNSHNPITDITVCNAVAGGPICMAVPEPSTAALLGLGLLGLAVNRRR